MTNEDKIHALKLIKLKIEPPTDNRLGWLETWIHKEDLEAFDSAIKALEQEPTTKNDLGVDCIDRAELLKAMDTWDKFGDDPNKGLIPLRTPTLQDRYVPYVKYDDMINCVKGMQPVTPQEPRWIPVSERLPEELWGVLVYCPTNDNIFCAYLEKGVWKIFSPEALEEIKEIVTAWMPLPKAYREVEE